MPRPVVVSAPAKINLFLELTGRRPDGYHRLATLFAKLDLEDRLTFRPAPGLRLTVRDRRRRGPRLPAGPGNLVLRAARALRSAFGLRRGASIELEKRIPVGAGLGGGSSDAAATLRGLARLWALPPGEATERRLRSIALALGADVPFFLQKRPVCLGRGIGERLTPMQTPPLPPLVLAYPGTPAATASAYRRATLPRRRAALTSISHLYKLKAHLQEGAPLRLWAGLLFNRLEAAVSAFYPAVKEARAALERTGARGVLMTGSGSAVFGFAPPAVAARLRRERPDWEIFSARVLTT